MELTPLFGNSLRQLQSWQGVALCQAVEGRGLSGTRNFGGDWGGPGSVRVSAGELPPARASRFSGGHWRWKTGQAMRRDAGDGAFEQALGLERPWYVERTEFDAGQRRLDLYLNFEVGGTFACGGCGGEGCKAYDTA